MRKLIAMVAVAAGLMLGSVANAAPVDILLTQNTETAWSLTVNNNMATGVGALQLRITGFTSFAINTANTGIDTSALTGITFNPLEDGVDTLIVQNTASGVSIAAAGAQGVLMGTLSGPGPVTMTGSEASLESATVYTAAGTGIPASDFTITVTPLPNTPEPVTMVLLGVGLAALGLVRRTA